MLRTMLEDTILVNDLRAFDAVVKVVVRNDAILELYVVGDGGLEEFAGRLDHRAKLSELQQQKLAQSIMAVLKQQPMSRRSLVWLYALEQAGLLDLWERYFRR